MEGTHKALESCWKTAITHKALFFWIIILNCVCRNSSQSITYIGTVTQIYASPYLTQNIDPKKTNPGIWWINEPHHFHLSRLSLFKQKRTNEVHWPFLLRYWWSFHLRVLCVKYSYSVIFQSDVALRDVPKKTCQCVYIMHIHIILNVCVCCGVQW